MKHRCDICRSVLNAKNEFLRPMSDQEWDMLVEQLMQEGKPLPLREETVFSPGICKTCAEAEVEMAIDAEWERGIAYWPPEGTPVRYEDLK